jgi:hypothetical protein
VVGLEISVCLAQLNDEEVKKVAKAILNWSLEGKTSENHLDQQEEAINHPCFEYLG